MITTFYEFKGLLPGLRRFLETERPFKMKENAFYFTLKALFVLETSNFLSWFFWSGRIRKLKLISKLMASSVGEKMQYAYWPISQEGKAVRPIHLVSWYNIAWEKFFLKSSRPFSEKSKLSISLNQQFEIFYILFLRYVHVED